jgi:hypothetical protein
MEQSKKTINDHSVFYALLHALTYIPATWFLKNHTFSQPVSLAIIIVSLITFAIFIFKLIKAISVMDEVKQRIQLEAVVIGFSLTAMAMMFLFLSGLAGILNLEWVTYGHMVGYCWLFYFIGWFISKRKYGA